MKKRIFLIAMMVAMLVCVFVISASATNKIIQLDAEPTLEQIHANPNAYISRLDEFETGDAYATYREADSESVVVLWDKSTTWYVYPVYYLVRSSYYSVAGGISAFNDAISKADNTAFAGYTSAGGTWGNGECDYIVRIEMPKYVTRIHGQYKFEGSANVKEIYFPVYKTTDPETGLERTVPYCATIEGQNLFGDCPKLEVIHNTEYLPAGLVQGNLAGFYKCSSLKEFKIPEGVTSIPKSCFEQCSSLTELILPNSVVSAGKMAFAYCTNLRTINFGASFTSFYSPNNDFETFLYSSAIKFVYLPDSDYHFKYDGGSESTKFYNIFNQGTNVTFFFTGSQANAQSLKDKFVASGANDNIANATLVAYDPAVDYTTYAATQGKNIIVYNYNACDAFYNGIHVEVVEDNNPCVVTDCQNCDYVNKYVGGNTESGTHTFTHSYAYANGYTQNGADTMTCANAGCMYCAEKTPYVAELAPIFTDFVYSRREGNEFGLVMVYKINKTALGFFEEKTGASVSFGIVAIAQENVKSDKALVNADGTTDYTSIIAADVSKSAPSTVTLVINGAKEQWDEHKSTPFYILGYAINNGAVEYFQNASNADASKLSTISFEAAPSSSPEAPAPEEGDDQ